LINSFEHELHSFSTNSKYVGLIGDFNSRTGEDDDYVNVNLEHGDNNIDEFIKYILVVYIYCPEYNRLF
jgi:hypothetical protein